MHRRSLGYSILRFFVVFAHRLYYRKIIVEGKENLPNGKAMLIAPNHQNALMDPLAVICTSNLQPVFLTRADIFGNAFVRKLFRFFRMVPIYRQSDGGNVSERNQPIFDQIVRVLNHKQTVAMFPEATHWMFRRLRPLKKGVARLAFMAEENSNWQLDLQIVPTGIYYSSYTNAKGTLYVRYGEPISVKAFREKYLENKEQAIRLLTQQVDARIKQEILHIKACHYDLILKTSKFYSLSKKAATEREKLELQQFMANKLQLVCEEQKELLDYLEETINDWDKQLKRKKLKEDHFFSKPQTDQIQTEFIWHILSLPAFIFGYLVNFIPMKLPTSYTRLVNDPHFHASYKLAIGFFVFPVYYAALGYLVFIATSDLLFSLAFLLLSGVSANLAAIFPDRLNNLRYMLRYRRLNKKGELADLKVQTSRILRQIDTLVEHKQKVEDDSY